MRQTGIPSQPAEHVWTVSELTRRVGRWLASEWSGVWVEGELSNARAHTSGHLYFTLKDERASLRGVMFRSDLRRVKFQPADGLAVRVFGQLTLYEAQGNFQIQAQRMEPSGLGPLELAFRQTFERLEKEGLFDPARKAALPRHPRVVGVVTSAAGAALHDVSTVLRRRAPHVRIVLRDARVQGEGAARDVARGIADLDRWGGCDVILVTRGGGAIEDLQAFNEEVVARAIHACRTPVVSAVGHEVDRTIADWAADVRAPTPSAGAEVIAPERREVLAHVARLAARSEAALGALLRTRRERVMLLARSAAFRGPLAYVRRRAQDLDRLRDRLDGAAHRGVDRRRQRWSAAEGRLDALSPLNILKRGYAIARLPSGRVLRHAGEASAGDAVLVRVADGELDCRVERTRSGSDGPQEGGAHGH